MQHRLSVHYLCMGEGLADVSLILWPYPHLVNKTWAHDTDRLRAIGEHKYSPSSSVSSVFPSAYHTPSLTRSQHSLVSHNNAAHHQSSRRGRARSLGHRCGTAHDPSHDRWRRLEAGGNGLVLVGKLLYLNS